MKRKLYKPIITLFIVSTLFTCIDPYDPELAEFQSLLVVDALLTDENASNYVSLSRTKKVADETAEMVSGALITITDESGISTILSEKSEGMYKTDSLLFRGETGRSYTLNIKTTDGEEYVSEPCSILPVQDIDSIYFCKDKEESDSTVQEGIRIYIDSKDESDCRYYRWTFDEWWKFNVPFPKLYNYVNSNTYTECSPVKKTCWAKNKSYEIIIKATDGGLSNRFVKKPILFIASEKSDRLLVQYSVEIRQFSISGKEYEFWDRMKQINDNGGDIFDKQPFQISGNIHNVNKPEEKVLGYFQVSGVKAKRIFITRKEVLELGIPLYKYECERIIIGPDDYVVEPGMPRPTFDQIYVEYKNAQYNFLQPLYDELGRLYKLTFATRVCSDCTLSGSLTKPDFWVDIH